jgi:hypothetical protein
VPLYRHTCRECGVITIDLQSLDAGPPEHCDVRMVRLMPRRVVGRVVNPTAGPPAAMPRPATPKPDLLQPVRSLPRPEGTAPICATRPDLPTIDPAAGPQIPWQRQAKAPAERNAGERDSSWHDTCEAMTEWQTQWLERDGVDRGTALRKASATQQAVVEQARSEFEGR